MPEGGGLPVAFLMAALAFGAVVSLVGIVALVAAVALARRVFVFLVDVAVAAAGAGVRLAQGEAGLAVVEAGVFPVVHAVAVGAAGTEVAPVLVVRLVAGDAFRGGLAAFSGGLVEDVAGL